MPKAIADFLGYQFYFRSNENNEPVHIHVSKGTPSAASTKFWISKDGVFMEGNHSDIPANDLGKIIRYIASNRADIIAAWYDYFGN